MDHSRAAVLAAIVAACGGPDTPDAYAEARAEVECDQMQRCALGQYESLYSSDEDCLDERRDAYEAEGDAFDELECIYSSQEAGDCVSRVRKLSCAEWLAGDAFRACDLVYSCPDNRTITTPYTYYRRR